MQCYLNLIKLVSTTYYISKATPANNTNYSCHTNVVELAIVLTNHIWSILCHIMLLVINSLGSSGKMNSQPMIGGSLW